MAFKYVNVPENISVEDCISNNYCLAPSKHIGFSPKPSVSFKTLDTLCKESTNKEKIKKEGTYNYTEIGNIDVSSGYVESDKCFGVNVPSDTPKQVQVGDILISTVRTYRGGIGFVNERIENHVCSPAIMILRQVDGSITKEYLFAVLRTDFFIEQILGFQNRGMYPRIEKEAMKCIYIPIPKSTDDLQYITLLVKSYLNKLSLIKKRHKEILSIIDVELKSNQKNNNFTYELPKISEIEEIGRLDTARYSQRYKSYEFFIKNYRHGFFKLSDYGYKVKRGQNLQISNIGQSYYSDVFQKGFYNLAISSNFSEYSIIDKLTYLGNKNDLKKIQKGDIVFSARGAQFGRVIVFPESIANTITNIDSLVIQSKQPKLSRSIFIAMFLNNLRWNKHIYSVAITGSGANSLTQYQSDDINFPEFPDNIQEKVAKLYYNQNSIYSRRPLSPDDFLEIDNEYNKTAGIYNLDKTAKEIRNRLNDSIDAIINGKNIKKEFDITS